MGRQKPIERNRNFMGFDMSIITKIEQLIIQFLTQIKKIAGIGCNFRHKLKEQ
jgi:hypothetical protein